jgi:hypothetical protein
MATRDGKTRQKLKDKTATDLVVKEITRTRPASVDEEHQGRHITNVMASTQCPEYMMHVSE